ncbi:hypothetical protein DMC47_44190 [Nostoc sp. 3335mG]|nr:hypothetical protein DMC47_44190 [Nostoc sp. 3335mG]
MADETPASPRNRLDLILAICAIFISAVSLVVAIQQSHTERSLVAADTWPYLQRILNNEYDGQRTIAIGISNDGVGPAKIKSVEMFYDGKPVTSGIDLLRQCCGLDTGKPIPPQLPGGYESSIVDETVLRAGQDNPMLKFHEAEGTSPVVDRLRGSLLKISFKACYCSTLDQCWTSDLRTTAITPVAECRPPEHPFDPNGR